MHEPLTVTGDAVSASWASSSEFTPFQFWGEHDIATADELRKPLDAYIATTEGNIVCDCTELEFLDSSAIEVLLNVQRMLNEYDRTMRLVNVSGIPLRILEITGLVEMLDVNA